MGIFLSNPHHLSSSRKSQVVKVLLTGLDNSGKTTILYQMKLGRQVQTIPTIGFNVDVAGPFNNMTFTVWDTGGSDNIRPLIRKYSEDAEGLIYVVDSSDRVRLAEARQELEVLLRMETTQWMKQVPLLVLANKQDLPYSLSKSQLTESLGLHKLGLDSRQWHVHEVSAATGRGLKDAMQLLAKMIKDWKTYNQRWSTSSRSSNKS